jgi:hypothetical protein
MFDSVADSTMTNVKRKHLTTDDAVCMAIDSTLRGVVAWLQDMDEPGLAHDLQHYGGLNATS